MRIKAVLGIWLLAITLAWLAVAAVGPGLQPLVDAEGAAPGWWQLRRHALYLSGLWSIGLMSLALLLALRLPWLERPLGGMDQVYRLHKWAGVGAALTAVAHWGAKESSGWISALWGRAGRPARDAVLPWFAELRGPAKDVGEWAFYLLLALVALTLLTRLLAYQPWRLLHRVMPLLFLALALHTVALMPLAFWALPLGLLTGALLALGSLAALWSLAGRVGRARSHAGRIHAVRVLGDGGPLAPVEVVCALPASWPGHRAGQFAFVRFDRAEGQHPFTIASAPGSLGMSDAGEPLLRLIIKPLGDYTRTLGRRLRPGQPVDIEGPYGRFDGRGRQRRQQVWVAGGVGITPFLALLEARQGGSAPTRAALQPVHMHYCTRDAAADPLLPRLRELCAEARPTVTLTVHGEAQGQRLRPQDLEAIPGPLDIWFCGPQGLGDALRAHADGPHPWRLHRESFAMR
ncbi:ferric reductase-like transmembrane domain-containing protein [Pulveribacter sp.]|uniref:ferredoxin reductase family protein n=1 Tax=Pulveribacter sp. TaxID=2678893 RepID=UPI0028AB761B|nr:ferric reductase-like transmembrane domain-containing protein [Pulveribacter sp.]